MHGPTAPHLAKIVVNDVRAETNMVLPGDIHDVLDMVDHSRHARILGVDEERDSRRNAYDAAQLGDPPYLCVAEVTMDVCDDETGGVRSQEGSGGKFEDVGNTCDP